MASVQYNAVPSDYQGGTSILRSTTYLEPRAVSANVDTERRTGDANYIQIEQWNLLMPSRQQA